MSARATVLIDWVDAGAPTGNLIATADRFQGVVGLVASMLGVEANSAISQILTELVDAAEAGDYSWFLGVWRDVVQWAREYDVELVPSW